MSTVKDLEKVDEDDSWQKLMQDIEAFTDNEIEQNKRLTEIVAEGFIDRFVRELGKNMMIIEKKGIKGSPECRSQNSFREENEYYLNRKQKKQKTSANEEKQKQETDNLKKKEQKQETGNEKKKNLKKRHDPVVELNALGLEPPSNLPEAFNNRIETMDGEKKKNLKKRHDPLIELTALGLEPPPDMPEEFKNLIATLGGTEIKLVIQKFIQVSDLRRSQNRLSMIMNQFRSKFLSEAEEEKCKNKEGMNVIFVEPCLEVSKMHLKKWLMGKSDAYVFNSQWYDVVTNNADSLKPMAVVQVWSFRVKSELAFALIKVRDGEDGHVI